MSRGGGYLAYKKGTTRRRTNYVARNERIGDWCQIVRTSRIACRGSNSLTDRLPMAAEARSERRQGVRTAVADGRSEL